MRVKVRAQKLTVFDPASNATSDKTINTFVVRFFDSSHPFLGIVANRINIAPGLFAVCTAIDEDEHCWLIQGQASPEGAR